MDAAHDGIGGVRVAWLDARDSVAVRRCVVDAAHDCVELGRPLMGPLMIWWHSVVRGITCGLSRDFQDTSWQVGLQIEFANTHD